MEHLLHTVIVSYNRLPLLIRTIDSYLETVTMPYSLVVVDNGSAFETTDYLDIWAYHDNLPFGDLLLLDENRYPGYAANRGFEKAPDEATLLHRSDNDMLYLPGWCEEVIERFEENPKLGQLGLRTVEEEGAVGAVGGNAVFRREVWDAGARYDERPWQECKFEDGAMSQTVLALKCQWERVQRPCVEHIGIASSSDPYYQQTFFDRGITFAEWGVK